MKNILFPVILLMLLTALGCSSKEDELYTGREMKYEMLKGSFFEHETSGYILVKERTDQSIDIQIFLEGTLPNAVHPVHLHYGSLENDGLVAEYLSPMEDVGDRKSQSTTNLKQLRKDSLPMTFDRFMAMDGSVKIHFEESGEYSDVILGASNIGKNANIKLDGGVQSITTCNSEPAF